jgi:hypothetical protein
VGEVVTGLVPSVGPEHGSSLVRVQGQGFRRSPQLSCMFGSSIVSAAWNSESEVECLSVPLPAGTTLDVRVANNGIDFSLSSAPFSFKGVCLSFVCVCMRARVRARVRALSRVSLALRDCLRGVPVLLHVTVVQLCCGCVLRLC